MRVLALLGRFSEPGSPLISLSGPSKRRPPRSPTKRCSTTGGSCKNGSTRGARTSAFKPTVATRPSTGTNAADRWPLGGLRRSICCAVRPRSAECSLQLDLSGLQKAIAATAERHQAHSEAVKGRRAEYRLRWRRAAQSERHRCASRDEFAIRIAAAIGGLLCRRRACNLFAPAGTARGPRSCVAQSQAAAFARRHSESRRRSARRRRLAEKRRLSGPGPRRSLKMQSVPREKSGRRRRGNATNGILLALEALPEDMTKPDRPYVVEAEAAFYAGGAVATSLCAGRPHRCGLARRRSARTGRGWSRRRRQDRAGVGRGHGQGARRPRRSQQMRSSRAAFSPDGTRVVTASDDNTARLWDAATGKPLGTPCRPHGLGLVARRSARTARAWSRRPHDKTARLWDAATGQALGAPWQATTDTVTAAAFSPDGTRVVTGVRWTRPRGCGTRPPASRSPRLQGHDGCGHARGVQPGRHARGHRRPRTRPRGCGTRPRGKALARPGRPRRMRSLARRSARTARGWSRRQLRQHRAGVGRGHGQAARQPSQATTDSVMSRGVQPGRHAGGHRVRRQDRAAVGRGHGPAARRALAGHDGFGHERGVQPGRHAGGHRVR